MRMLGRLWMRLMRVADAAAVSMAVFKSACHGRNYLVSLWLIIDGPETDTV